MPEFDFSGAFINVDNVQEEDILTIIGSPVAEEKTSAQQKEIVNGVLVPKKYMVLNIPVEYNGLRKTYTPDSNTGNRMNVKWGRDYSKWVGKQFTVRVEKYTAFGQDKKRVSGFPM